MSISLNFSTRHLYCFVLGRCVLITIYLQPSTSDKMSLKLQKWRTKSSLKRKIAWKRILCDAKYNESFFVLIFSNMHTCLLQEIANAFFNEKIPIWLHTWNHLTNWAGFNCSIRTLAHKFGRIKGIFNNETRIIVFIATKTNGKHNKSRLFK